MMQKIKDLMQIKELIDDINKKVDSHNQTINNLREESKTLHTELTEVKTNQKEFLTNLQEDLRVIKNLREDFAGEMYQFKLLKSQMQRKILEQFEDEMQKELKFQMNNLEKDHAQYEDMKKSMGSMSVKLNNLTEEVNKFLSISSSIKEKDFEMEKFAKELLELDSEKLQLMKKIDTMERLVSKMRRGR